MPQPLPQDNLSSPTAHLGPHLVPRRDPTDRTHSALTLWHLLSLDAPTVAALWTYFLAHCAGVALPWTAPAAMFVAVWMIYAADRLLDARSLDVASTTAPTELEERHRFHHRHRNRFLAALAIAACALVCLLPHIAPRALLLYTLLATLLGTWLLFVHARGHHRNAPQRLPKELAVGVFFSAAVFIPTVSRAPWLQLTLFAPAALFAGVCALNCLFVYAWEHPHASSSQPQAHWTTLWAVRHLPQITTYLVVLGLSATALTASPRAPLLASALSASLLLLLHVCRHRLSALPLRAAADAVLLTPLLFLLAR